MIGNMDGIYQHPARPATPALRVVIRPAPVDPPVITLAADEVHVWTITLGVDVPAAALGVLSADESARFERYKHPRAKAQFARCRAALRTVLAGYLGGGPEGVRFGYKPDGKPEVAGGPEFNLSHTDGVGMIAVAAGPVGIDVETGRDGPTADALVERFFAPAEREQYRALPAGLRAEAFLRGWTCKEALLKAVGCGARGLEGCVVDIDPRRPPRVVELRGPVAAMGQGWDLECWPVAEGVAAAVAVL